MWIILCNAVDEFGVREINHLVRSNHPVELAQDYQAIEAFKQKLMDEALHGALRISGLVSAYPADARPYSKFAFVGWRSCIEWLPGMCTALSHVD